MFELTEQFKQDIYSIIPDAFTEKKFNKGITALEQLLCISDDSSSFDEVEIGDYLNKNDIRSDKYDLAKVCKIEGFLRKICNLKGVNTQGAQLREFYQKIGFYTWLNEEDIKKARANDPQNAANAENHPGIGFHLHEAESSAYVGCSHYFEHYIVAYQLRNGPKAHDNPSDLNPITRLQQLKSVFIVYLDQCIRNSDIIEKKYIDEVLSTEVKYSDFSEKQLTEITDREREVLNTFIQLDWMNDTDDGNNLMYDFSRCVKLYGEPGLGKTTQMRMMYYRLLKEVRDGKKETLPIWIDLADFSFISEENASLEGYVNEHFPELGHFYRLLIKNNRIAFFLDGYNEILSEDDQLRVKRKIAQEILDIHEEYPQMFIAMTDRSVESNPVCLSSDVILYTCKGLTLNQRIDYAKAKAGDEISQKISDYMNSEEGEWFTLKQVSPIMMNSLIELIENGQEPEDEEEFYDSYLDYIIQREKIEKQETRMNVLLDELGELANIMNHATDEQKRSKIRKLWKEDNIVGMEFDNMLKLATELGILVPGTVEDNSYKFSCQQYYEVIKEKWG